jgi:hypothetical protein
MRLAPLRQCIAHLHSGARSFSNPKEAVQLAADHAPADPEAPHPQSAFIWSAGAVSQKNFQFDLTRPDHRG